MQLKSFLFSVLAVSALSSFAQDKIFTRDGETINAKIKSIDDRSITYWRFDNPSGPEYTMRKNDVNKVVYQNGAEETFDDRLPPRPMRRPHVANVAAADDAANAHYRQNVLALAPLQFTENGLGLSLSYERVLDNAGIIAFYMPLVSTFNLNNGTYYDNTGAIHNGHQDIMLYAMPGVKVYPTGCYHGVKYAIGPSLVIASGQHSDYTYDPTGGSSEYKTQEHAMLGMLINNSLNINPTPHIYLGLDFGFGFTYLNRIGGVNQDTQGLVQGGFKMGYRF